MERIGGSNLLERAAILADGGLIVAEHFAFRTSPPHPASIPSSSAGAATSDAVSGDLKAVERSLIERALIDARFNKSKAARQLGLTRAQLYAKLKRYGMA